MKKLSRSTVLVSPVLALAAWLTACGVSAQEKPAASEPPPTRREYFHAGSYSLEIVDGELITGGKKQQATLSRVADVLRQQYPDANIVLAPELGQLTVMDLKLRSTELAETLEALRVASGNAFVWHRGMTENVIDPRTGLPVPPPQGASQLYILQRNEAASVLNPGRMVEVFNLSGYLAGLGTQDDNVIRQSLDQIQQIVSETIDQAMQGKAGPGERPSFRFHGGANLFIVIGSPEAIEVARKVVGALPGVVGSRDPAHQVLDLGIRPQGHQPPPEGPRPGPTSRPGAGAPPPGQ